MDGYRTTHHPRLPFIRIWGAYCLIHQRGAIHLNASQVQTNSSHRVQSPEKNSTFCSWWLSSWVRAHSCQSSQRRMPPELTSEVRGSHRGIGLSFCLSDEVAVVQMPLHSPLLLMHLPLHPGFGGGCHGILASSPFRMNLKKKPVCPFMFTYFLVSQWQLVCWGVLGSDAGSSVLHPLESSCVVNLSLKWLYWAMRHLRVRA